MSAVKLPPLSPLRMLFVFICVAGALFLLADRLLPSKPYFAGSATIACIQGAQSAQAPFKGDAFCRPNPRAASVPGGKIFQMVMPHERQGDQDKVVAFEPATAEVAAAWAGARLNDKVPVTREGTHWLGLRLDGRESFGSPAR